MGEPQSIPQSIIYELVNETINKEAFGIEFPKAWSDRLWYIFFIPLTHIQFISIPSPLSKRNANYYPLTLLMSTIWIFIYSYIIVWFTYDVTNAFGFKWSIIPMFIYPFGITLRDVKKFKDFRIVLEQFKQELPDQEISLAETYSPQIFQMTGVAGFTWLISTMKGDKVVFSNESIQYQVPCLITVVILKYCSLMYHRFKTSPRLWRNNCFQFALFIVQVLIIEYYREIFG